MAEQSQLMKTDGSGEGDAESQAKPPTMLLSTTSPKFGSSIPEHPLPAVVPEIRGAKNNGNVILIDDSDSPTEGDASETKTGDVSVEVASRGGAHHIANEPEVSSNRQHQYQAVARSREPEKKTDTTKQTKTVFIWNTDFVPPTHLNAPTQKQQQSNNSANSNDFAARDAPQGGRHYASGNFPNFHELANGHQQAVTMAAVQQHQAAASAAEHHLLWRMNACQGDARKDSAGNGINRSHLLETAPSKIGTQRDQILEQYTAEIARRLSGGVNPSNNDRKSSAHLNPQTDRNSITVNERKRSLSESEYSGNHPPARRLHHTERRPSHAPTSAQLNRSKNSPALHGSKMVSQVQDISDTMDIALDEAADHDAIRSSKASSSARRADTPMTYLVRQLLGQVEVYGNEPAVVLAPNLVKEASLKIRAVINKLMEKVAEDAKRESQMQIREAEARSVALEDSHAAHNMKTAANLAVLEYFANAQQKRDVDDLKSFAEEQVRLVQERESVINSLRNQLRASQESLGILRADLTAAKKQQHRTPSEKHSNATIRNLISQLDDGMTKLQQQKKEIDVLKAVIRKDAESLKGFHDMRMFLINTFGLCDPTTDSSLVSAAAGREVGVAAEANPSEVITSLRSEVEELKAALKLEHERGESALRAYMRAAVHALKIQKESFN